MKTGAIFACVAISSVEGEGVNKRGRGFGRKGISGSATELLPLVR